MVYHGTIRNGVVVFDNQPPLADGTSVRIEAMPAANDRTTTNGGGSVWDAIRALAGSAEGLPADFAARHDEYRRKRLGL